MFDEPEQKLHPDRLPSFSDRSLAMNTLGLKYLSTNTSTTTITATTTITSSSTIDDFSKSALCYMDKYGLRQQQHHHDRHNQTDDNFLQERQAVDQSENILNIDFLMRQPKFL